MTYFAKKSVPPSRQFRLTRIKERHSPSRDEQTVRRLEHLAVVLCAVMQEEREKTRLGGFLL